VPDRNQTMQYFCSSCNSVLEPTAACVDIARIAEQCPHCGDPLASTLNVCYAIQKKQPPGLQTIRTVPVLTLGLKPVDDFFLGFRAGTLCVTGSGWNLVVGRLCVRAILPKRRGGLESSVLFIDTNNNSDVYQCVNFARQYGLDTAKVLGSIIVSRAFTIYQLARLLVHELGPAVQRFGPKLVVVSGLLAMFKEDPQVDPEEARRLLKEMMAAVKKMASRLLVVIAADGLDAFGDVMPGFDGRLEMKKSGGSVLVSASTAHRSRDFALPVSALRLVAE
jgi:hypothetical protein